MRIVYNGRVRLFTCIAFIFIVSCFAQTVAALDLYNDDELLAKLRKNQVMSEKDITEVKSGYPKLELMGSLQLQYLNVQADANKDKISDLFVRRLNVTVVAHVTDKTSFIFEPEYGRGEPSVRDAFISYKPSMFAFFAGNHRVPFGAEVLKNDINLPFVERSLASDISPDRLPGVSLLKKTPDSRLIVQAGIWNASINSEAEANMINNVLADNRLFSATSGTAGSNILIKAVRIGYSTKGREDFYSNGYGFENDENFSGGKNLGLGFSYYSSSAVHGFVPGDGLTGLNGAKAYEGDLQFRFGRFSTEFEYAKRNLDWWQYSFAQTSSIAVASVQTSVSAQASVLLTGNVSLTIRRETFEYDSKSKVLKGAYGQDQDRWLTVGLNYYMKSQNSKLQLNYVKKAELMPVGVASPANNTVLVQATTYF